MQRLMVIEMQIVKRNRIIKFVNLISKAMLAITVSIAINANAQLQTVADFDAIPPTVVDSTTPLVMLVMSRDNQLWHKAYTDYTDLDGDGTIDTTYNDRFEYYGYFRSDLCYTYANGMFSPAAEVAENSHKCSGQWSGNFMNWLTTTRIDVVRKVLYGGYRSTDTATSTVLQRAFIPSDNHAFVKVVDSAKIANGSLSDFTPITGLSVVSFCNVTDFVSGGNSVSGNISDVDNPPKLKMANGNYAAWSGGENKQCQFTGTEGGDSAYSPPRPTHSAITSVSSDAELIVRVETCSTALDSADRSSCKEYEDSSDNISLKPYGILQTYGETGEFKFGLMTGSYDNKAKGGVLRKNITFMGGPDSTTADQEINSENGVFITRGATESGIINTINRLRVRGWNFSNNRYEDCSTYGISINTFLTSTAVNRKCADWGNPISELYLEALRYFANTSANSGFAASDTFLPAATWSDPFTTDAPCSKCSIIVLSTGLNNFDGDDLYVNGLPNLNNSVSDFKAYTDQVGVSEGLTSGDYVVGTASGGTSGECDAKQVPNFSEAVGPCPEVPRLEGTYNIAGGSYYSKITDLRTDLIGEQFVNTYTVSLSENMPSFDIPTSSGESVKFVPTCQAAGGGTSLSSSSWQACSLVDLTVLEQRDNGGTLLIAWEDSMWGNDYDMDAHILFEYCTATGTRREVRTACPFALNEDARYRDSNNNWVYASPSRNDETGSSNPNMSSTVPGWRAASSGQIQFRFAVVGASAGNTMKFGYILLGSDDDGAHIQELHRVGGDNFLSAGLLGGPDSERTIWSKNAKKVTATSGTPTTLENPLWYAAKYGNFTDLNGNNLPDLTAEWDALNLDGTTGSDGIPDGYFPVSNPAELPNAIARIFDDLSERVSAGSAAAVNAQTGSGEGAVYQALYAPTVKGTNSEVTWVGSLHSLFIDDQGRIREDSAEPKTQLTDADNVLSFYFDDVEDETKIQRYTVNGALVGDPITFTDSSFSPIWSAREQLGAVTDYISNRSYASNASGGRYIFTSFDRDGDGNVISPEYEETNTGPGATDKAHAFVASNFSLSGSTATDHGYLGLASGATEASVENLINFIRGQEGLPNSRSRSIYDGDGNATKYLIGDIVHSTPAIVAKPAAGYHLTYRDRTYREFAEHYRTRRNVIYVGANDGMLHAFNAGFFNSTTTSFGLTDASGSATAHPLGSELWGYVPYNLLPHLQWLKSEQYPHVYYMDGIVKTFDVNIFEDDTDHPDGWGTIVVAGMRFGGGEFYVDHDADEGETNPTDRIAMRSGYVILDVTNPEVAPKLIAEITHPDLGYSVSEPALIKYRMPNPDTGSYEGTSRNRWYIVFGSGPAGDTDAERQAALDEAVSSKSAKLFVFDLNNKSLSMSELTDNNGDPELASFVGGVESVDWTSDFVDDAIYFGLVSGDAATPGGKLKRGKLSFSESGDLNIDFSRDLFNGTSLAFSASPLAFRDVNNDYWVFAGTGRYYVAADNLSTQQQSFFGIKEPKASGIAALNTTVANASLVDTSTVDVYTDGRVFDEGAAVTLTANGATLVPETFEDVQEFIGAHGGWRFDLYYPVWDIIAPRMRVTTKAAMAGNSVIFTAYDATGEYCDSEGNGYLFAPYSNGGAPGPFAPVGTDSSDTISAAVSGDPNEERVLWGVPLGVGVPSSPIVTRPSADSDSGDSGCDEYMALIQKSTGEIVNEMLGCESYTSGRQSWREIPVTWEM